MESGAGRTELLDKVIGKIRDVLMINDDDPMEVCFGGRRGLKRKRTFWCAGAAKRRSASRTVPVANFSESDRAGSVEDVPAAKRCKHLPVANFSETDRAGNVEDVTAESGLSTLSDPCSTASTLNHDARAGVLFGVGVLFGLGLFLKMGLDRQQRVRSKAVF